MRTYTQEEKQAVIDRVISGEPSARILADTGIPKSTFYSWLRIYQEEQNAANRRKVDIRNFHLLENKVARLESIVEILKSAPCTPRAPLRQRLYAAEQLYGKYNVHVICDAFDIPRGTFYNHVLRNKKDNTWYAKRREELRLRIQEIYDESNQIFGAAKIAAVMKSEGFKVSNEMVRTLMRDMGLVSIRQSAKKLYEDEGRKYKNHLNQEFDTCKPNEVWVSDVTYFKYGENAYYICVIIDLFSRKRMIFHAVEDGEDIVQSGRRILPVLLGGSVFCQFLFKLALFCHQIRNAGISEQLLLIFGSHAVQQAFEFLIDLRNADLYFNALVLSGPGTEAQPNVLLEGLQDIRVDLRCFQNCIHDGVLQWCFFHRRRVMAVFFAVLSCSSCLVDTRQ